jgi:hypothetical protein
MVTMMVDIHEEVGAKVCFTFSLKQKIRLFFYLINFFVIRRTVFLHPTLE